MMSEHSARPENAAKPASGAWPDRRPTVELLHEVLGALQSHGARRELRVECELDKAAVERDEQPAALLRVLKSLSTLAVDLAAFGAALCLRVSVAQGELQIDIDSIGAHSTSQRRGLAKLYRVSRSVPPHAGFALHAASVFARANAGTLRVQYVEQLGLNVTLRLPLARAVHVRSSQRRVGHSA
jgi:hypothetical protein